MFGRTAAVHRGRDGSVDSGTETAESDCSRMSSSGKLMTRRPRQQQQQQHVLMMDLHLLANPGDSLLLQHTLDRLLRWLCPSLRIFHVSERASPLREHARPRLCPTRGYPSLAITFFLHEAYGEERILRVLDFFQSPPWQYHHTESSGGRPRGVHVHTGPGSPAANGLLRPYLLPSRDFYRLGAGMPVWGVRPVHCGGEILRVTVYSSYDNYEDAVRLYETVLQRQAEEQKAGFCWFTIHAEPGLCLQLALKQLAPEVRVEPCSSAVLQFRVEEIGQLVPLLPNPCTPISSTRWQTEDLDGNKILFQVKTPAQPQRPLTCAFPPTVPSLSPRGVQLGSAGQSLGAPPAWQTHSHGVRQRGDAGMEKLCGVESLGSGSCCSSPPGSSCYSSQRSSPAPLSTALHPDSPLRPAAIARSLSHLLLEEDEEDREEGETNVDTGAAVSPLSPMTRSLSADLLTTRRPTAIGASAVQSLVRELSECLTHTLPRGAYRTRTPAGYGRVGSGTCLAGRSPSKVSTTETDWTGMADASSKPRTYTHTEEAEDEFFI